MLWPPAVLPPEDVGLDAGRDAASSERLADDISGLLLVEVPSDESVGNLMLVFVEDEGDGLVGVVDVEDIILRSGPEREIKLLAEFDEGLSCGFEVGGIEDFEGRDAVEEGLDGRDGLHLEGEEEGMVGDGAELESEAVSCGEEAGVWVAD